LNGVGDDTGHDGAYEADAEDYDDFMALGAVVGDEGLEALDFSRFLLRSGQGKLFAGRRDRVLSAEDRVLSVEC
jgi:hypothetical protein